MPVVNRINKYVILTILTYGEQMVKEIKHTCSGGTLPDPNKRYFFAGKGLYCGAISKCRNGEENLAVNEKGEFVLSIGRGWFGRKKWTVGEYFLYEDKIVLTWTVRWFWFWRIVMREVMYREDDKCLLDSERRSLNFRGKAGVIQFKFKERPVFTTEKDVNLLSSKKKVR